MKKAQTKIKDYETKKDAALEALDRLPTVRDGVYLATFAGLTYAYKEGVLDIVPGFFYQFGEKTKDPMGTLTAQFVNGLFGGVGFIANMAGVDPVSFLTPGIKGIIDPISGLEDIVRGMQNPALRLPTSKEADQAYKELIQGLTEARDMKMKEFQEAREGTLGAALGERAQRLGAENEALRNEIRDLNAAIAYATMEYAKYTFAAWLIAMGLAGGTMLFLMETSTSEVMDIGAKALDAVTPLT